MGLVDKLFGSYSAKELKRIRPQVDAVLALEDHYRQMDNKTLQGETARFKELLANGKTLDDILPEAFAACREAADRVLGMRHFPVQVMGGIILHQGRIAEMKTGEGKTLVATLPAYLNALSGKGVHVVTVNEYLARRDSEWMGNLYRWMGLTVGLAISGMSPDEKRAAYAADITYGTNNEFGFDYLRDNMVVYKRNCVQRGWNYAIVDEVDSILIDEARTPLIISGAGEKSTDLYEKADRFAATLTPLRVKEMDAKDDQEDIQADYIVDEKARTATITPQGARKAEQYFGIESLNDPENLTLAHHINQAIAARGVMQRDIDYVVKDGEVIIVDEFTGRLMIGRRYSNGLHQAIEAKEGVTVARENRTLATITFQNYFRMYDKLAGMTGTAMTEEQEFRDIYRLDVVELPTNKPLARVDLPDAVYKTQKGKYAAILDIIAECYSRRQPILVGTTSIEKSEMISKLLKARGIPHEVLNAKFHEKEAEIVAQAGKPGAVTISTNMAGRGTDIMLGGNAEFMAKAQMRKEHFCENLLNPDTPQDADPAAVELLLTEANGHGETTDANILAARQRFDQLYAQYKPAIEAEADEVRKAGGLFIIGTERHESRRIDNQLRGRAGRQGDPGASRFFLSLEDDLMRIFGGDRVQNLMDSLGLDEDVPIENKLITNTIESAQKKLEASNFAIRKQVLQYDDVMNQQREIIYKQRQMVLDGEDISGKLHEMMRQAIDDACTNYLNGETADDWDFAGLRRHFMNWLCLPTDFNYTTEQLGDLTKEGIADELYKRGMDILTAKEKRYGAKTMRELERICLLRNVDSKWMEHIDNMDQLKQGMGLRGYGQHDPVVEYRIEGFAMFDEMIASIREDAVHMLLTIEIRQQNAEPKREQIAKPTGDNAPGDTGAKAPAPVRVTKIGRNDPCPCGSGLKWKKCTCKEYHPDL